MKREPLSRQFELMVRCPRSDIRRRLWADTLTKSFANFTSRVRQKNLYEFRTLRDRCRLQPTRARRYEPGANCQVPPKILGGRDANEYGRSAACADEAQFSEFLFQCEMPVRRLGLWCRTWATRRASARRVPVTIGQGLVRALDGS
jgi:hypothetical protein